MCQYLLPTNYIITCLQFVTGRYCITQRLAWLSASLKGQLNFCFCKVVMHYTYTDILVVELMSIILRTNLGHVQRWLWCGYSPRFLYFC